MSVLCLPHLKTLVFCCIQEFFQSFWIAVKVFGNDSSDVSSEFVDVELLLPLCLPASEVTFLVPVLFSLWALGTIVSIFSTSETCSVLNSFLPVTWHQRPSHLGLSCCLWRTESFISPSDVCPCILLLLQVGILSTSGKHCQRLQLFETIL
jgi:hypothetical protein